LGKIAALTGLGDNEGQHQRKTKVEKRKRPRRVSPGDRGGHNWEIDVVKTT